MASRCEDYPACGHTDGLPCDWVAPNFSNPAVRAAHHIGCDHEAGYCDYLPEEDDEEEEDPEDYEENEDADFDVEDWDEERAQELEESRYRYQ